MSSVSLDDRNIRKALIDRLSRLSKAPKAILEELRVHNGNAIADVVAVYSTAHCYEIKGDNDSVQRILRQSRFYDLAFNRTTLVTTDKQLEKALRLAPPHWGIMRARQRNAVVTISYVRSASPSPTFDKRLALLTLWRSELVELALSIPLVKVEKMNRSQLSRLIASALSDATLSKNIGEKLLSRHLQATKVLTI